MARFDDAERFDAERAVQTTQGKARAAAERQVLIQRWEVVQRNGLILSDSYTLHLNESQRFNFIAHRSGLLGNDGEHLRPSGEPYIAIVSPELFTDLVDACNKAMPTLDSRTAGWWSAMSYTGAFGLRKHGSPPIGDSTQTVEERINHLYHQIRLAEQRVPPDIARSAALYEQLRALQKQEAERMSAEFDRRRQLRAGEVDRAIDVAEKALRDIPPRKTMAEVEAILAQVRFLDRKFVLTEKGDGFMLQVSYVEPDVDTGQPALQKSRKWYVSPWMTETEIVDTALGCVERSWEHVLHEHFTYKGLRVFSPHFSIEARLDMARREAFDVRPDHREKK